jgi:glycine betaine catabolism A
VAHTIPRLLKQRRPGYSLEAPFYTSEELFRADMNIIFARHWIFTGQEPDVTEPGDVIALRIGEAPILLLRDDNGQVRAFHNVCRHRGAQLVADGRGHMGNLVCRYHTWTYGLDGRLLFANHMGGRFRCVLSGTASGCAALDRRTAVRMPCR